MIIYLYTSTFSFIIWWETMKSTDLQMDISFSVTAAVCQPRSCPHFSKHALFIDFFSHIWLICIISPGIDLFYFIFTHCLKHRANTMHSFTPFGKGNQPQTGFSSLNDENTQMNQ